MMSIVNGADSAVLTRNASYRGTAAGASKVTVRYVTDPPGRCGSRTGTSRPTSPRR
ncbi:hypothetical protein [Catenuloplanes japonicus]|uniref:hypothetical protein n=1 Tax=Catenuloplanes japonicus TaxID=33876 RepID=UPI000AAA1396|nr:hypothetical protein [Catenuloplanes japonicus]